MVFFTIPSPMTARKQGLLYYCILFQRQQENMVFFTNTFQLQQYIMVSFTIPTPMTARKHSLLYYSYSNDSKKTWSSLLFLF
jgi:hypothetical protein